MSVVKEVCCICKCTQWVKNEKGVFCDNCGTIKCSATEVSVVCEPEEIKTKDDKRFFIGNLRDHLGECD